MDGDTYDQIPVSPEVAERLLAGEGFVEVTAEKKEEHSNG